MKEKRFEVALPNGCTLIAEGYEGGDYPCVNILYKDRNGQCDFIASAEYDFGQCISERVRVRAYENNCDEPVYSGHFHKCFSPTFTDLEEIYHDELTNSLECIDVGWGLIEIFEKKSGETIFCSYKTDEPQIANHIGHSIHLVAYKDDDEIINLSIECEDCNEVLYSVDKF